MNDELRPTALVFLEQRGGQLVPAALEALAAAQQLSAAAGLKVEAAVLGNAEETAAAASQAAAFRVEKLWMARHARLSPYVAEAYIEAAGALLARALPQWVFFCHSYQTRDYAPRLADRAGRELLGDVTALRREEGGLICSRPMYQGKLAAEFVSTLPPPLFLSLQIGAFSAEGLERAPAAAPVEALEPEISAPRVHPGEPFREARQAVDLGQAGKIVAVGRGIREEKNIELARQLAELLGAELAASRPICDNGWLPMDRQVGSSGQTVAPRLYLALGISGAIQHLVGMKASRTVVAINKDAAAPIFEAADIGAVGDLFEIVPALIAALKARA